MPQVCTVCTHAKRADIDRDLVAGAAMRAIACQFTVGRMAVQRHASEHLPAKLTQAQEVQEVSQADQLLDQVRQRFERAEKHVNLAEGLCGRAAGSGDIRGAVAAVSAAVNANREVRSTLELMAKLQGQLAEQAAIAAVQVNVGNPYANLSDTELDNRIVMTLEDRDRAILDVLERARQRQERGEIPPGTAAVMAEAYGPNHPRTTLAVKLDHMNTIRQGECEPIVREQPDEDLAPPAQQPRPRPSVAPAAPRRAVEPSYWTKQGW